MGGDLQSCLFFCLFFPLLSLGKCPQVTQSVDARPGTAAGGSVSLYEKQILNALLIFCLNTEKKMACQVQCISSHTESVECQLDEWYRTVLTSTKWFFIIHMCKMISLILLFFLSLFPPSSSVFHSVTNANINLIYFFILFWDNSQTTFWPWNL